MHRVSLPAHVRPAVVAGTFYPASPVELESQVDALLAGVAPRLEARTPKALIVPHAGYRYSGTVAAAAFARLAPGAGTIARVVLAGPSHRVAFRGLALPEVLAFDTPLGRVPVDADAAARIPGLLVSDLPHAREHSLEVELPFLLRVLPRFRIVPVVVGEARPEDVAQVFDALWGGPETVFVVSSDLSHYHSYDLGHQLDVITALHIAQPSDEPLSHDQACGADPVNGLLLVAKRRGLRVETLALESSGDHGGGLDEVVGYGAFAFYEEPHHVH